MQQYDSLKAGLYDGYFTGVAGDVPFYVGEAALARGPVLELGCGTGRITLPMLEAGVRVTGVDSSPEMLALAQAKLATLDPGLRRRARLVQGDMRDVDLGRTFQLILIPYRTFMHLLTPTDQVQALLNIRAHLAANGRLIFNIYDPSPLMLHPDAASEGLQFDTQFTHPANGRRVMAWYSRRIDIAQQLIQQHMLFEELDDEGAVVAKHYSPLTLRYSHRYEMHYLLEMCGYEVHDLYGDFERVPYYGGEQIWVAKKSRDA
jgi:SAM-dependent methyltransferase